MRLKHRQDRSDAWTATRWALLGAGMMAGCAAGPGDGADGPTTGQATVVAVREAAPPVASKPLADERPERPLHRYEFRRPEMGVPFRIVLYAWNPALAKVSAKEAFARIEALNAVLSDYEFDSELTRLSRTAGSGDWAPVSPDLWRVLDYAQALARETDGAFDITVGPAISLWRRARRRHALPPAAALARARAAIGYQKLRLEATGRRARLEAPRMKLDLGAVAKGFALDEALKVLEGRGIRRALLAGGGDLRASGPPPGQSGWRVELAPLDVPNAPPPAYLRLAHGALATSGDLFQHVEIDGVRYSHIVDPRTGVGLTDHSLVTVLAPTGMEADSLATAVSVLGPDAGLRLIEARPDVEAQITRQPGAVREVRRSRGFAARLESPVGTGASPGDNAPSPTAGSGESGE